MTYDPYGSNRQDRYLDSYQDQSGTWGLAALAVLVLLGVMLWAFSGGQNTASNPGDTNTGAVTRPAPAPANPAPAPSRP
jgi:hypothetical protein